MHHWRVVRDGGREVEPARSSSGEFPYVEIQDGAGLQVNTCPLCCQISKRPDF